MGIRTIFSGSVHFTRATLVDKWSRWLIFIVLGLPWLALYYIIDADKIIDGTTIHWELVPWVPVAVLAIAGIICSFFVSGYLVRLLRGGTTPPEFDDWPHLAADGIKLDIVILLWLVPVLVIIVFPAILLFGGILTGGSLGGFLGLIFLLPVLIIIALVVLVLTALYGIIGIIRFARTGSIREGFALSVIGSTIARIGRITYIVSLVILLVVGILFSLVAGALFLIPYAGKVLAACLAPFLTVFQYRVLARIYDSQESVPVPQSFEVTSGNGLPQTTGASWKDILKWGCVLVIILAIIFLPLYLLLGSTFFSLPSMTAAELGQAQNDDISIYGNNTFFAYPQFTHDGNSIVYIATTRLANSSNLESDIWIMNRTGNYQTQVTHVGDIKKVFLDPVSDKMAYNRYENGNLSLYIRNDIASPAVQIDAPLPFMYFSSWSPDGKRFAATGLNLLDSDYMTTLPDGENVPTTGTEWSWLFVMNADGSAPQELAKVSTGQFDISTESSWSPNGTMLVAPLYSPGNFGLGVIETTTGSIVQITRGVDQSIQKITRREDTYPRWSPDGNWIAFIREGDVYLVKPDGTNLQNLTADGTINALAWSPDSSRLAFSADHYLGVINPDGSNLIRIANIQPGPVSWNPDEQTLVYCPGIGVRIRIMALTPGVIKMGEFETNQLEATARAMGTPLGSSSSVLQTPVEPSPLALQTPPPSNQTKTEWVYNPKTGSYVQTVVPVTTTI